MHLAERQGFEPWDLLQSPVFKTGAIDHSATSPKLVFFKGWGLINTAAFDHLVTPQERGANYT